MQHTLDDDRDHAVVEVALLLQNAQRTPRIGVAVDQHDVRRLQRFRIRRVAVFSFHIHTRPALTGESVSNEDLAKRCANSIGYFFPENIYIYSGS